MGQFERYFQEILGLVKGYLLYPEGVVCSGGYSGGVVKVLGGHSGGVGGCFHWVSVGVLVGVL